jgi:hypothetical protein
MGWSRRKQKNHMLLSRHQNAAQNYNKKIVNRLFVNAAKFRNLVTTLTKKKKDDVISLLTKIRGIHRQTVSLLLFFIIREVKVKRQNCPCT